MGEGRQQRLSVLVAWVRGEAARTAARASVPSRSMRSASATTARARSSCDRTPTSSSPSAFATS
eukprot:7385472-Prymnesium_polylepis.1